MFQKIHKLINRVKHYFSKQRCYDEMERRGYAVFGTCGGMVGGDRNTEYLSYDCIGCKYFVCRSQDTEDEIRKKIRGNDYEVCKDCPYYYGEIDQCMRGEPDVPNDMEMRCK